MTTRAQRVSRGLLGLLLFMAILVSGYGVANAEVERFAVLIGNNIGAGDEENLRFAESDASKLRDVIVDIGGFRPQNVVLMTRQSASAVRRGIIAINDRLRQRGKPAVLLVYYSGHADARALHLGGSRLPISELEQLVRGSSADVRLLVLDSCRSGALTRVKGGKRVQPFSIDVEDSLASVGVVFLTSSAANEDAQESDELKGSFFTHYLVSGLLGAADENADGRVTLSEVYRHAYDNTLRASSRTLAGLQHPTFRFDLSGTSDVVLARPARLSSQRSALVFPKGRTYLVFQRDADGAVVAEVGVRDKRRTLSVRAGSYYIRGRGRDHMLEGVVYGTPGQEVTVSDARLRRTEFARLVRKGASALRRVDGAEFGGAVRSKSRNSSGVCVGAFAGYGIEYPEFSISARLNWCRSGYENVFVASSLDEVSGSVRLGKAFDLPIVTLAPHVALGAGVFSQRFETTGEAPSRTTATVQVEAGADLRVQLHGHLYLTLGLAAQTYWFRVDETNSLASSVSARSSLGLGWFL